MRNESFDRKKMSTLYILEILRRYTDEETDSEGNLIHTLTQTQVRQYLEKDFQLVLDRKAVKRGLFDLTESMLFGDMIGFEAENRNSCDGSNECEIRTNFYCRQMFNPGQTRLLTEAVMFYRGISANEAKELIEQIGQFSNISARNSLKKNIIKLPQIVKDKAVNEELINNIDVIDEAITKGRQIMFTYNYYGTDMQLHPKLDPDGDTAVSVVNPYRIVPSDGRLYLVCNYDNSDSVSNVRIDQITDAIILDTSVKSKEKVKGLSETPETLAEQLYFQSGEVGAVKFRLTNNEKLVSEAIDWFGRSIIFLKDEGNTLLCSVKTNLKSMRYWAMQYSDHVEIVSPDSLREEVRTALRNAWRKYNGGKNIQSEAEEEIDKLISDWEKICAGVDFRKGDNCIVDISVLGAVVRKTQSIMIPFVGKKPEGKLCELILSLQNFSNAVRSGMYADQNSIYCIINSLLSEIDRDGRYGASEISEDVLNVRIRTKEDGFVNVVINLDNFEEDYLTLNQYSDKNAEEHRRRIAELRERIKQHHSERVEEYRRRKKMSADG